jgi:hypothetical protein
MLATNLSCQEHLEGSLVFFLCADDFSDAKQRLSGSAPKRSVVNVRLGIIQNHR